MCLRPSGLVRKSSQNVEKIARSPGGKKSVESCHVPGCHAFFSPDISFLGVGEGEEQSKEWGAGQGLICSRGQRVEQGGGCGLLNSRKSNRPPTPIFFVTVRPLEAWLRRNPTWETSRHHTSLRECQMVVFIFKQRGIINWYYLRHSSESLS